MNKKVIYNSVVIVIFVVFFGILTMGRVGRVAIDVVTVSGSYADTFAEKTNLGRGHIPDSIKGYADYKYENFSYNIVDGEITIEGYNGKSSTLVVPRVINGYQVSTIGEKFFDTLTYTTDVYLPTTIDSVEGDANENVVIHVNSGVSLYDQLEEQKWRVSTYNDSDSPNFDLGDIPFTYNMTDSSVNLVSYTGSEDVLIIPSYIDGVPVTTVSFDLLYKFSVVYFPDTVTTISGQVSEILYSPVYFIELIFCILALVIVMLILNDKIPMLQNSRERVLTGPQIGLCYVYFIAQLVIAMNSINGTTTVQSAIIVNTVLVGAFIILIMLLGQGRQHVNKTDYVVENKTYKMKQLKAYVTNIGSDITDPELQKMVNDFVEEVRYSDPVSNPVLDDIETQLENAIIELKNAIKDGNSTEIKDKCKTAMDIVKERNVRCKVLK
ncbi:MAG: hypothetical protein K5900_08235 [Butyrivibrio sp.]|nr:hypothetical protein [Butyrivibrio sp.]